MPEALAQVFSGEFCVFFKSICFCVTPLVAASGTRKATGFKSLQVNCCEINLVTSKCQMNFLNKTCKKRFKTEVTITIEFHIFEYRYQIFWTKLTQKGCFRSKTGKMENHYWILHIRISLGAKFQLHQTIFIFWDKFTPEKDPQFWSPVKNRKKEHHHWILHIQISLSTIFRLKLTILIFWTKFVPKNYFWLKAEKLNITIEFCIFESV